MRCAAGPILLELSVLHFMSYLPPTLWDYDRYYCSKSSELKYFRVKLLCATSQKPMLSYTLNKTDFLTFFLKNYFLQKKLKLINTSLPDGMHYVHASEVAHLVDGMPRWDAEREREREREKRADGRPHLHPRRCATSLALCICQ